MNKTRKHPLLLILLCILYTTFIYGQQRDSIESRRKTIVKLKLPITLGITGSTFPGMISAIDSNQYGFSIANLNLNIPIFFHLKLGDLRNPIKFSTLFFSSSSGYGQLAPAAGLPGNPVYSQMLGLTYLKGELKNNYIAGLYAFENADEKRFLDAPPGIAGLFLYSHTTRNKNTIIAGAGLLVSNGTVIGCPVIGYLGKISSKWSYLIVLPAVASINYKANKKNSISMLLAPQGNYFKLTNNSDSVSIADTTVKVKNFTFQTGSIKTGFSWTRKIANRFELYTEAGFLIGNSISVFNEDLRLKENLAMSPYFQIGITINLTNTKVKQSGGNKDSSNPLNKKHFTPSMYNIERIFLD